MSHFTVLVIGQDPERQLAPFHEFECTGVDDEYVKSIDETEEYRSEYAASEEKQTMSFKQYLNEYHEFPIVHTGDLPDHANAHKYNYIKLDANGEVLRVIRRTNPNKKWDWYSLGGRWTGFFKVKDGSKHNIGRPGIMTPPAKPGYGDQLLKKDIDFDGMRKEAYDEAVAKYDQLASLFPGGAIPKIERTWKEFTESKDWEEKGPEWCRNEYNSQSGIVEFREALKQTKISPFTSLSDYQCTREEKGQKAADNAIATFAVLKDGVWYEKGEMGWFACVSNEKADWGNEFKALIDSVPDDTLISVYDCHI